MAAAARCVCWLWCLLRADLCHGFSRRLEDTRRLEECLVQELLCVLRTLRVFVMRRDQAIGAAVRTGSCRTSSRTIVSSRSEPVETMAARTPDTSSRRAMYLRASAGS